jgi:hypothetical protein
MGGKTTMAKPRRVSVLSSVLKETQEYNKVSQEDEQVTPTTVEQETVNTEKQNSVDTDKHIAVNTEMQKSVNAEIQPSASTEKQNSVNMPMQKSASTEEQKTVNATTQKAVITDATEKTHKQTILISEDLAFRLKVHAARRKETIASIATIAFEKLLEEEETE